MEIVKQGKAMDEFKYSFVCPVCGCEFIANRDEINTENITCQCPNCNTECNGLELAEGEDK